MSLGPLLVGAAENPKRRLLSREIWAIKMEEGDEREQCIARWAALGLRRELCEAAAAVGWSAPTLIQRRAIPLALAPRDVIGLAETGSGKTGAFALPLLHSLLLAPQRLFAVVLAPTRELAYQIHEVFEALGRAIGLSAACVVGGIDMMAQALALAKRPHVIVATPGRLVDHLEHTKGFSLRATKRLVIDEADRMLSMDFEEELDKLLLAMPAAADGRATFLFSATMTSKVAKLQRASLHRPAKVDAKPAAGEKEAGDGADGGRDAAAGGEPRPAAADGEGEGSAKFVMPQGLVQQYLFLPAKHKDCYLVHTLNEFEGQPTLVFASTCAGAQRLALLLRGLGLGAGCLHGKMSQPKRLGALNAFKAAQRAGGAAGAGAGGGGGGGRGGGGGGGRQRGK